MPASAVCGGRFLLTQVAGGALLQRGVPGRLRGAHRRLRSRNCRVAVVATVSGLDAVGLDALVTGAVVL